MGDGFQLQPKESALIGMSVRDGALRIGATGPQRMTSVLWGTAAVVVTGLAAGVAAGAVESIGGVGVDHPAPLIAALVGLVIGLVALAVETARAVVVASPDGLTLRGRGLRRSLPWSEVLDLQVAAAEQRGVRQVDRERFAAHGRADGGSERCSDVLGRGHRTAILPQVRPEAAAAPTARSSDDTRLLDTLLEAAPK